MNATTGVSAGISVFLYGRPNRPLPHIENVLTAIQHPVYPAIDLTSIPPPKIRTNMLLSLLLTFLTSLALAAQSERSVTIEAWPLSASKSQSLAKISYTPTNATVKSYSAPTIPEHDDIVRIGFHHPSSGSWSGVATAASNFKPGKDKKVQLHVNAAGEVYHVGFVASEVPRSSKSGKAKKGQDDGEDVLGVEVVRVKQGEPPHLNKPVVLDAEGKLPQKEAEKSFLQK